MGLSDFFKNNLNELWDKTAAADDYSPLPSGTYEMEAIKGGTFEAAKKGTPGYKITWRVRGGEYDSRLVWQDLWLTPKGLPMAKQALQKLGVTPATIERPLQDGIVARVQLVQRQRDDGTLYNEIKRFDVQRIEVDPFAPEAAAAAEKTETAAEPQQHTHPPEVESAAAQQTETAADLQQTDEEFLANLEKGMADKLNGGANG